MREPPAERPIADRRSFGVINLDKPPGPSAHEVAGWVRDLLGVERAGHAGTLDPKVTGCLPILTGDATRIAPAFQDADKEYVAVLELHDSPPERKDIEAVFAEFTGPIYQKPPRKSAVARTLRVREIYDLTLLEIRDRQALLRVRCESGTYVRKLCHDLGLALGTGAHMGDLRRTAAGRFNDGDLVTLQELVDAIAYHDQGVDDPPVELAQVLAPAERALNDLPRLTIAPSAAEAVATGAPVYAPGVIGHDEAVAAALDTDDTPLVACFTPDGTAVCLGSLVGDPRADSGTVVDLTSVLVNP